MIPQIRKSAKKSSRAGKEKTISSKFIDKNLRKNRINREEYLYREEVKTAIKIIGIEQRIYAWNKVLSWLEVSV
jgi:hypothetical protein